MFSKVAQAIKDAGLKPHVRNNEREILIRDEHNQLYIVTVKRIAHA